MSAKAIRAGKAFVELGANDSALKKGLDAAQKKIRAFGKSLTVMGASMSAAGAAITAPIGMAVASFAQAGDSLNKMSLRTGASVESLSELGFAAEQSGSDLETLSTAMLKMTRSVADAARGSGPAQQALAELGITASDLAQMSPDKQFEAIAGAMSNLGDTAYAAQLGFEIFGRQSQSLFPLLMSGADGIEGLRKQARDLGITMSTEDAAGAARFSDALNILNRSIQKVWHVVASAVVPALTEFMNFLTPLITASIQWAGANKPLIASIAGVGAALGAVGTVVATVGAAMMFLPLQIVAVSAALTAGIAAFLQYTSVGQSMLAWFSSEFGKLKDIVGSAMTGVFNAIKGGKIELAMEIAMTGVKLAVGTIMQSAVELFGSSIKDMMTMLGQVYKAINETIARLNVARVEIVNWISGSIGDALNFATGTNNFDTSFEQANARKQAQGGLNAAMQFDPSKFGQQMADSFDTDKLQEKLDKLNESAAAAAEAIDTADTAIKAFEFNLEGIGEGASSASSQMGQAALGTFAGALAGQTSSVIAFQNKQLELSRQIANNTKNQNLSNVVLN